MNVKSLIKSISTDEQADIHIGNFLDAFYKADIDLKKEMISEEPEEYIEVKMETYAFIAGAVDKLCSEYNIDKPEWIYKEKYILSEPHFPDYVKGKARIWLCLETPAPFRLRNVFVSANVLTRV
jgi:hypothetical protein